MYVVDANVAIKWLIEQPDTDKARALSASDAALIVPALFVSEVAATLWKYVRAGAIELAQAEEGLQALLQNIGEVADDRDLVERAWAISSVLQHPPYDLFYLALAEQRSALFITADKKLIKKLAATPLAKNAVLLSHWKD
jgi:predicted nucleic acid-binding protein